MAKRSPGSAEVSSPLLGSGRPGSSRHPEHHMGHRPTLNKSKTGTKLVEKAGQTSLASLVFLAKASPRGTSSDSTISNGLRFLQREKHILENYPKLDADSVRAATAALAQCLGVTLQDDVHADSDSEEEPDVEASGGFSFSDVVPDADHKVSLKERYHAVLMFKRRPVTEATLLHFAIWFASEFGAEASVVEALLEHMGDPDEVFLPAYMAAGSSKVSFFSAVHLAAGLGQVDILRVLTKFAHRRTSPSMQMTGQDYVSQWATLCPAGTSTEDYMNPEKRKLFTPHYQPIHDSTYAGNAEVTLFLLRKGADPVCRNYKDITPLHFIAFVGISGGLEDTVGDDLKRIIDLLQRTGIAVGLTADMGNFIKNMTRATPLEVAVADASRFPQDHLGLLAPCLAADNQQLTYFDDIKRIADVTAEGALKLVRNIGDKGREKSDVLRRFRVNAQMEGKSDVLASILYTAPLAASEMLELLEVSPEVEDAAHHPIPAKTSLWGLFQNVQMRCTYQTDTVKKQTLMLPIWEWKTKKENGKEASRARREGRHSLSGDKSLILLMDKSDESSDIVSWHDEFVPRPRRHARSTHIKNINVVVSLLPNILDIDIFMALAHVQYEHLAIMKQKTVQGAVTCLWSNLVEDVWKLQVFFRFVDVCAYVTLSGLVHTGDYFNSISWPIVASGNLDSLVMLGTHVFSVLRKWSQHEADDSMHDMWSPASTWNVCHVLTHGFATLVASVLVLDLAFYPGQRDRFDDALMALCVLISCFRFIWMWRLSVIGGRIYTIVQTFLGAAVNQMLFITFMLLFSFIAALQVLSRLHTWRFAVESYRGFLFGDGDGFDGLGMDVDHGYDLSLKNNGTLLAFSVFGSFFFNVIVLNIIIAIYGNEYDRVEPIQSSLFMKGRADYCVKTLLSCYIISWRGHEFNRGLIVASISMIIAGIHAAKYVLNNWIAAVLLALGQVLLPMALVQCAWVSPEGADSDDSARYLWICHPPDWQQWTSDYEEDWQDELTTKQEYLDQRIEGLDERVSEMTEKIDQLLGQ